MNPQPDWTGPQYNAWVESGATREDRKARLEQVPGQYRKDVERHLKTVWAIRNFYSKKTRKT